MNTEKITIEIMDGEQEAIIEFNYFPGHPAIITQTPENSHPEETEEWELISLKLVETEHHAEIDLTSLLDEFNDYIIDQLCELREREAGL